MRDLARFYGLEGKIEMIPGKLPDPLVPGKIYILETPSLEHATMMSLAKRSSPMMPLFAGGDNTISEFVQFPERKYGENLFVPMVGWNNSFAEDVKVAQQSGAKVITVTQNIDGILSGTTDDVYYQLSKEIEKNPLAGLKKINQMTNGGLLDPSTANKILSFNFDLFSKEILGGNKLFKEELSYFYKNHHLDGSNQPMAALVFSEIEHGIRRGSFSSFEEYLILSVDPKDWDKITTEYVQYLESLYVDKPSIIRDQMIQQKKLFIDRFNNLKCISI